jgi:uncharacterized protein YndB with AHSA1/START domain
VAVDVEAEVEIALPRSVVAAYAADPANATEWYENVERVEWKAKTKRLGVGSQFVFVGTLLGRRLTYTYRVTEFVPLERLVMRTDEGPFAVETTYTWRDTEDGATRMTLRSRGEPSGLASRLTAPLMASAMRRTNRNDLTRLKELLESVDD